MRKEFIFSAIVILLLGLGGYAYYVTAQVPAKIAESSATMKMTDSMRMTFKVSIMARRGFETYLLALRDKNEDQVLDAQDFMKASLGFVFSDFIDKEKLVEQVVPLIRANLEMMEAEMLQPSAETLRILHENTEQIHRLTEQIEKEIWISFQKNFVEFKTNEQRIQLLYQLILIATVLVSLVLFLVFIRQKRLNRELVKTEAGLRESEHLLREAQTLARLGNWDLDLRTGTARWSEEEYRLLGYLPGKVEPSVDNFMQSVHPEDREPVTREMQRAMKPSEEEPYRVVHRVITPDGERLLEQQGRVEFSADGQALRMFGTTADVTDVRQYQLELERYRDHLEDLVEERTQSLEREIVDRKLAQEELKENEARLRQILESSTAGISILGRDPVRRVYVNQHFLDMFGAESLEELEAAGPLATFVNLEDGQASRERLEKGVPLFQVVIERKRLDGSRFWVLMDAASIEFEGAPATIVWHYDITDQKRAEQELVEARLEAKDKLFHRLTESLPAAVCQFQMSPDGRTRFPYASQGIRKLLEVEPDAVLDDASEAFARVHPDDYDALMTAINTSRTELKTIRKEFRVRLPEGGEKWLFTESVPEKLEDDSVLWHGYVSDITDLKRSQSELERYRDHLEELVEERTHDLEREIEERRAAEAELHGSQKRLRQILESADAGISIVQRNPVRRIYSNQRFLEMFGVQSLDELDAAGHLATFVTKSEGVEAVSRLERGEAFYRSIIQRQSIDGIPIWVLMDSSPIEFEGKEATIVWHYDITDQKRAEDELVKARLEAKDQLLERLTERLQGMIYQFRMDPDGNTSFPYASQGIRQVYEVEPEEVMEDAAVVFSRIHPDDLASVSDSVVESRDQLTAWRKEYRVCLPERGERWLYGDSVPEKQEDGSVLWHGYISDVTELKRSELELEKYRDRLEDLVEERTRDLEREIEERKAAQIELRKSEERHRGILDSSSAGISILRLNPVKRVYANQRFLELFHAGSADEMDAYGFKNTFVQEADHDAATECVNNGLGFDRFIMERRCVDGSTWWGLHDAIPIEFEGAPATIVWHYDITDQKMAEKELVQSEKLASLGGLVAGIAHEVNTPIGVSVTAATYLEEKVSEITGQIADGNLKKRNLSTFLETAKESSAIITSNLHRASDLVRSFKQVAVDQSSEERRTFKVLDYFDEIVQSLHPQLKKTRHEITIQGDRSLVLTSYPGALSQIITNLVMNSLTHAFGEGEAGHIRIEAKKNAKAAHISYHDDGEGVPPEALRHIFDPFFTTSRGTGGSGLGMNIVYNLVTQKLGGTVVCDSKLGEGISVHITVPYEHGEAE